MMIQRNGGMVGSLGGTDPNAHSFQNPERQKRQRQNASAPDETPNEGPTELSVQGAYRHFVDGGQPDVGSAISFGQTQEAFLARVQQALQRMEELAALV